MGICEVTSARRLTAGAVVLFVAVLAPAGASRAAESVLFNESAAHQCYLAALRGADAREVEVCDAALEHQTLKPADFAATLSNRGLLLTRSGRFDEALRDHARAIKSAPEIASLYINRSNTLTRAQRFDEAMSDLDRAIELASAPSAPSAGTQGSAAQVAPATGDTATGDTPAVTSAPDIRGELAAAHYNRALLFQRRGDLAAALADATRARDLAPDRQGYRQFAEELAQARAGAGRAGAN